MNNIFVIAVSIASGIFGIVFGVLSYSRGKRHDYKIDTSELTTVIVKLENIMGGIAEIKSELKNVKEDLKDLRSRLIVAEESAKQAHKRLDRLDRESQVIRDSY